MARGSVLIVEDEGLVALDVSRRLKKLGYTVAGVAADGATAIDCVRDQSPDVVMMDIKIEGDRDGVDVATEITRLFDIPVVYLTAFSDEKTMERAREAAPYGYLVKPINDQEMDTALEIATYRHRLEQSLRNSRQRFLDLVESTDDWVWEIDHNHKIIYSSPQSLVITGLESSGILGRRLSSLLRDTSGAEFEVLLDEIGPEGRLDALVSWIDTSEGEHAVETNANPIVERDEIVGWRGISRDITERVKFENELKRLLRERDLLARSLESLSRGLRCNEVINALLDNVKLLEPVDLSVVCCELYRPEPYIHGAQWDADLRKILEECTNPQEVVRILTDRDRTPREFPLMSGEDLVAVLIVSPIADGQELDESTQRIVKLFCTQAAVALQNALAYEHQLRISTTLQESLRPEFVGEERFHVASAYESATKGALVGGDFMDLTTLANGNVGIFVGDVSGKGLEASLDTASLQYALRALLGLADSPGQALTLLNETVGPRFKNGRFSTLFAGTISMSDRTLAFASAGHPNQLILTEDGEVSEVGTTRGPAIGMFRDVTYIDGRVEFSSGDTLWLFTDGVLEARDPNAEMAQGMFGIDRLKELISAEVGLNVEEQVENVLRGIKRHTGGHFTDDVALLAFSFKHS